MITPAFAYLYNEGVWSEAPVASPVCDLIPSL